MIIGHMKPSKFTKNEISEHMLIRGHSFIKSAILLYEAGGSKDVELYNICQGIEISLKSFLLFKDYNRYKPLLPKKKYFGHDLIKLFNEVKREYKLNELSSPVASELETLNTYYVNHYLRYSGIHDIFFPSTDVEYTLVIKKLFAGIKLADRQKRK